MQTPQPGVLLRAFIGVSDWGARHVLYRSIIEEAQRAGLAGATVLRGPVSYGFSRRINSAYNIDGQRNPPMVVEIVDTAEKIDAFLPQLDQMIGSGLVTLEPLRMFRCGRKTAEADRPASAIESSALEQGGL